MYSYRRNTPARKTFSHAQRLSRATEIEIIKRTGKRVKTEHLDIRLTASPLLYARVGIVVPKYQRSITKRNRLRRRLRELVRIYVLPVTSGYDVLIRPLPHAYLAAFDVLKAEVVHAVAQMV